MVGHFMERVIDKIWESSNKIVDCISVPFCTASSDEFTLGFEN